MTALKTGTDGAGTIPVSPAVSVELENRSRIDANAVCEGDGLAPNENTRKALVLQGFAGENGEIGIRTLDTDLTPYNGLANRRLQPLGHLSGGFKH